MRNKNIVIEHARIAFRNFSGDEGQYNPIGRRNFCVLLDDDIASVLKEDGWNVKYLKPREEGDAPQAYMQVIVKYGGKNPPKIVVISSRGKTLMNEETVNVLDWAEIENIDLIIRPYNWDLGGRSGITAYLSTMYVTITEDELEKKYMDVPDAGGASNVGGCGHCETCDGHCHDD